MEIVTAPGATADANLDKYLDENVLVFSQRSALVKIIGWHEIRKYSISREIKRLELRIAELIETIKDK